MQFNDGQLLARFLQNQDESAFEDLVKRHATMVMAACRMVLKDGRDAEEAFQNTFTVLALKAHQHTGKESINGWLYRVAVWKALNIRSKRSVQARHIVEQKDAEMIAEQEPGSATALESMKGLLAEELNRLADKYSLPLILCYLEGKSAEQTAHDLGLSDSALKVRLMRGRELLRKRLVRRGVTVSAGTLAVVLLEQSAKAAEIVSEALIQSTVKAAMATLSAVTVAEILAGGWKGVLLAMTVKKTAAIIGGLILFGLLGSIAYWSQGKQKSLAVRELPTIIAHQQAEKPSEALTAQTGTTEQISDLVEKITLPESIDDFLKRFVQGLKATGAEKWKIWRQLGIGLTDEEFEAAWAEALQNKRFKEDIKPADKRCALLDLSPAEVAMFLKLQDAIFTRWVDKNPLAAVEWCKGLLSFPPKIGYEKNIFYMNFDQEGLLPERKAVQPGNQYKLLASMIACWGKKDLKAATEWAQAQSEGLGRNAAMVGETVALSRENPAEAIKFMEKENIRCSSSSVLQYDHLQYVFSNWAIQNRREAIAYLEKSCPGNDTWADIRSVQFNAGMDALGYQWSKEDLNGALQWTETIANIQEKNAVLGAIVAEWARKDLQSAENYVTALWERQDNENNFGMLYALSDVWLEKDPEACAAWALQLTDKYDPQKCIAGRGDHWNENVLAKIFIEWASKDHEAAFQWAENLPPNHLRDVAFKASIGGFVHTVCRDNEFSSIKECATLFDEINYPKQYKSYAYKVIAGNWAVAKPQEAIEWVRTFSNGGDKDDMIMGCCFSEKASYPEKMQWASEMQGKLWREKTTKRVFFDWCNKNMDEAKNWAQNSSISETADKWIQESSLPQSIKDKWLAGK